MNDDMTGNKLAWSLILDAKWDKEGSPELKDSGLHVGRVQRDIFEETQHSQICRLVLKHTDRGKFLTRNN